MPDVHMLSYISPITHHIFFFWKEHEIMSNECFDLFPFLFVFWKIGMYYLVIICLSYSKIQYFLSVHGHKYWSVTTKCSPLSYQTGTQNRDWASMKWPIPYQCLWVISGDCCGRQHHFGRCSGSQNDLVIRITLSSHRRFIFIVSISLQGDICCHQHHGVIWPLHSMNMKVLIIN